MRTIIAAAVALAVGGLALAGPATARSAGPMPAAKVAQDAYVFGERSLLNINNMSLWFQSNGSSANNPLNSNSGVTFPRSTDQIIYQDGLIWGGLVQDGDDQVLRVGGQTYAIGTVPGAILSRGVAQDRNDPSVRIYRIRRDYAIADLRLDASELFGKGLSSVTDADVAALRGQYAKDWREWPAAMGAPFYDRDGDGVYTPQFSANGNPLLDGTTDEPGVANGDMVAWFAINDLDVGAATSLYGSKPIGLETQITIWGYARTDALGDVIFKKYQITYEGTATTPDDAVINDMYISQWSDPDLGDAGDDFAGADTDLSLGYVYNGQAQDSHYTSFGLAPPAAGYDFLQGPIVPVFLKDENGATLLDSVTGDPVLDLTSEAIYNFGRRPGYKNLPMTSFVFFAAGSAIGDPELGAYTGTEEWYNLLRGFQPQPDINNPVPFTNPLTGADTKFTLDGDPTRTTGWNDGIPLPAGDRRIVLDTGPFTMALGDTQEVVVALLGAVSTTRLGSVAKLKFTDQFVQDAYNSAFEVPSAPAPPSVNVVELPGAIVLDWGWDPRVLTETETIASDGFAFEGYNVYQLPAPESSLSQGVKVGTFDLINGVTTILGISLDEDSGIVLDVPQQIGIDVGVKRNLKLTRDAVRGGPLVNGQEYYFAVTAYNRATAEGVAITTLESSPQLLIVKPQDPPVGTRYGEQPFQQLESSHTGASEGGVQVTVINPTMITGSSYNVTFSVDEEGTTVWSLESGGAMLLEGESQISPTDEQVPIYLSDHGFEILVSGPPLALRDWEWEGPERWISGFQALGCGGLFGGACVGPNFFGSSIGAADLKTTEIEFSTTPTSKGYRYLRGGDPNYGFQDFVDVNLTAWVVEGGTRRQVNFGFVENAGSVSENGTWDLASEGDDRALGGREYMFVMDSDYSATPLAQYTDGNPTSGEMDMQAAVWPVLRGTREMDLVVDGQILRLIPYKVNTVDDMFSFNTIGALTGDAFVKQDLAKINVFPNPYYGVNKAETSRYNHFVTFSHLPNRANIRIFDLSGVLVRLLEKDDSAQFLRWELDNENGLPVATGMYLVHIDLPDQNKTKILRLAVIGEQQFLENF